MAQTQNQPIQLPATFCVISGMHINNTWRQGYELLRSEITTDENNRQIIILYRKNHNNAFFNIVQDQNMRQNEFTNSLTKKPRGRVIKSFRWKLEGKSLTHENTTIPIITMRNSSILPTVVRWNFIPIIQQQPLTAEPVLEPALEPALQSVPEPARVITISPSVKHAIPQHAIRALLRDAAMQEEICAITGEEIDIINGAVTSCFHLFEKNAIQRWLDMPSSQDKCPVCNEVCKCYTPN
jgi:hypothetical protein